MNKMRATAERLSMFSDGVFAVLITVLVLGALPGRPPPQNHTSYSCPGSTTGCAAPAAGLPRGAAERDVAAPVIGFSERDVPVEDLPRGSG